MQLLEMTGTKGIYYQAIIIFLRIFQTPFPVLRKLPIAAK